MGSATPETKSSQPESKTETNFFSDRINRIEISATLAVVNEADKLRSDGVDLVDFGAGEPHFSTPRHIKDAAIRAIESNFTKYTAVAGTAELRDAIAARHAADFGSNYNRDEIIATSGGKSALFNAFQVLIDRDDEVIIPIPYWASFKDIVNYAGGKCVFVQAEESENFAITPEMIEKALTPRTKAILLNSPNNPSGAVISPEYMTAIVEMAYKRGIHVLTDECYAYLNYSGRRFSAGSLLQFKDKILVLGSLSKTYAMTGWRMGYSLGPASIIKQLQKLQSQSTSHPASIVQKAAVAALKESQKCVEDMSSDYVRLRDRMLAGLCEIKGIKCCKPEGAFYAYPNVSAFFGRDGIKSVTGIAGRLLREAHVVTVPGEAFGTTEHIRLSFATSAGEIDRGLERMKDFFGKL